MQARGGTDVEKNIDDSMIRSASQFGSMANGVKQKLASNPTRSRAGTDLHRKLVMISLTTTSGFQHAKVVKLRCA